MTQSHRIRSDETWAQAREAYLAGEAAASVCARFDLGLSALRTRARQEGWRRTDQGDPAPLDLIDADDDDLTDFHEAEALNLARRKMLNAVGHGRVEQALRWGRMLEMLERMEDIADRREEREDRREKRQEQREERALFRRMAARASLTPPHRMSPPAPTPAAVPAPVPMPAPVPVPAPTRMHEVHELHSHPSPAPTVRTTASQAAPSFPEAHALHPLHLDPGQVPTVLASRPEAPQPPAVAANQRRTSASSSASPAAMAAASGNRTTPLSGAGQVASPP